MTKNMLILSKENKIIVFLLIMAFLLGFISEKTKVQAKESVFSDLAKPDHTIGYKIVDREAKLEAFLQRYNSPMAGEAATFIEVADKYNMDYRLLPAISCLESTCGRVLIPDTYNPFGWGIYGDNYIAFESWAEGIETVGKGIHEGYILKGADTVEKMAPIYNPPTPESWGNKVKFFMNQIENS